jgi:hypothetical protein
MHYLATESEGPARRTAPGRQLRNPRWRVQLAPAKTLKMSSRSRKAARRGNDHQASNRPARWPESLKPRSTRTPANASTSAASSAGILRATATAGGPCTGRGSTDHQSGRRSQHAGRRPPPNRHPPASPIGKHHPSAATPQTSAGHPHTATALRRRHTAANPRRPPHGRPRRTQPHPRQLPEAATRPTSAGRRPRQSADVYRQRSGTP